MIGSNSHFRRDRFSGKWGSFAHTVPSNSMEDRRYTTEIWKFRVIIPVSIPKHQIWTTVHFCPDCYHWPSSRTKRCWLSWSPFPKYWPHRWTISTPWPRWVFHLFPLAPLMASLSSLCNLWLSVWVLVARCRCGEMHYPPRILHFWCWDISSLRS